jgi:AIG2-like family
MREGWLTAVRAPSSAVHGVLWNLALSDIAALDRYEGVSQGLYVKLTQAVIAERGRNRRLSISASTPGLARRAPPISPRS